MDPQCPLFLFAQFELGILIFTWTLRFGICHRNCSVLLGKGGDRLESELDLVSPTKGILGETVLLSGAVILFFWHFLDKSLPHR